MTNTFKKSFLLFAAVVMASTIWADVTLFDADFSTWSAKTYSAATFENGVYFNPKSNKTILIDGTGVNFNGQNASGKSHAIGIPVSGVNGSITVTISHSYGSASYKFKFGTSEGSDYTSANPSLADGFVKKTTETVNSLSQTSYVVWFGEAGSSYKSIKSITITTPDGGSGGGGQTPTVNSVTVAPATATLDPNSTQQLTATVSVTPSTADKSVTWESSNTSVATVSTTGLVTAVAQGTATITAKSNLDNTKSGSCAVTVNAPATPIPVTSIALNKTSAAVSISGTETLTVSYTPSDANTGLGITWSSSDPTVATVNNGVVTGIKAGTATITATSEGGKTATCAVTVQAVAVTDVTLAPTIASVRVNNTTSLTATVQPANATDKSLTWSSSNPAVATVNNGTVTGVSAGTATITVTTVDGGKTATCAVTVTDAAPIPPTNLTLHEPGVYEEKRSKGGYATKLVEDNGREYEVYYPGKTDNTSYASVCTTPNTQKMEGITNNTSATYTKAQDGWFDVSLNGGISNCSITATNEFPAASTNVYFKMTNNNAFKFHVKGYDQFSFLGKDKKTDTSSKQDKPENNQWFEVYIDGVLQPAQTNTSSITLRRYDMSFSEHLIEVRAINGGNSEFYGFSLRVAQVPKTTYLKGNDSTQIVMQTTALRPITYYTKYNSFGETKLVWDGLEATGISLQLKGSSDIGDTLVVTGIASCPVGVYNYFITTYYNNVPIGSIPGKFEVQSDIKALTTTSAEGYQGMNINPINFSYHALSANDISLTWENGNAPGGVIGSGADGLYSITGAPQNSGTFIYTVTVSGGNSISDTLFIEELVLGANPVLYLYKNARAYLQDGVYQYLSSTDGGYNLVPFTAINGKRSDSEYNRFKAIIISEDVDADNPEAIELIRDGASLPILNLNGFTYAKDEMRLGWGDPNNGAIDPSKTNKQQGCKITIERSNHPIYSKLLSITEGKEVKILDNYVQNGVMPIAIDNMPYKAACLATAPTRGVEYYDAGPLQTAIHEIPTDQRPGKYICMPLARQVTLSSDGKKLVKGIMEYLLSPTPASLTTPELRITKFIVGDVEAVINETEKTIKLQLTKAQYDEMDLTAAKPKITLADPIYSHVTPASNEEVNLQYATIPTLSKAYVVSDFVNRVVYQFMIQLINPQDIEEVYEIGQWVNIFDIYGRKVTTTNEDIYTMDLPHGMYIVVTENGNTLKIMR